MKNKLIVIGILFVAVSAVFVSCSAKKEKDTSAGKSLPFYESVTNDNTPDKENLSEQSRPSYADDTNEADNTVNFHSEKSEEKTSLNDSKNPTTAEKDSNVQKNDVNSTIKTQTEMSTAVDNNYPATDKDGWVTKWY